MARPSSPRLILVRLVRRAAARRAAVASGAARVPFRRGAAVAVAALALAGPAAAQQTVIPLGGEVRANTTTAGEQRSPSVARDADGDYVVVWEGSGTGDTSYYGIFAQRYAASGAAVGGEFLVNTTTADRQVNPSVAVDADGDFVVAWHSYWQDGSGVGVYAQRFAASGAPVGGEFRVNTFTFGHQRLPSVAVDADGDFVVAWQSSGQDAASSYGVYAQRYAASGAPVGGEFRVNTVTANTQSNPSVAVDADGDVVVAWQSNVQDGSSFGVYAQRYAASGAAVGGEFRVNSFTTGTQNSPSVAVDADGDVVVAWQSFGQDGSSYGVYAQRFAASGAPVGGEFRVNTFTASHQFEPSVAVDADGDVVVAWNSFEQEGAGSYNGIYAQRYAASGAAVGGEFRINTFTTQEQRTPSVAVDADGDVVVAWQSGQDGANNGVYAQRYAGPNRPVASGGPRGGEIAVNTYTTSQQRYPSVAADADGDYVVAWESFQDGSGYGVYARRYTAAGIAQGDEIAVNTVTFSTQSNASVAVDADGDFVVAWQSQGQDGSIYGVYAQRYNAAGVAQGAEFQVNAFTTSQQRNPSVALDADGDFVVAWQSVNQEGASSSEGVYARRFNAVGVAQGGEFLVNTFTTGQQRNPSVAVDADGDFAVAWQSYEQEGAGSREGVYAQRFNAAGVAQGGEFLVNTFTTNFQSGPSVALDADGDFVVAWQSYFQDGSSFGVYAQRYAASGAAVGGEFLVNTYTTGRQLNPSVAVDADGDVVVAWNSNGQDGSNYGVYARRFNAAGVAQGGEIAVNTYTTSAQDLPSVAVDADGDVVVAWASYGQDGSQLGIYAQRYQAGAFAGQTAVELRGTAGYRMLAAPTAGLSVGTFLDPLWTQGFPGADFAGGGPSVYRYDESAAGNQNLGYVTPASASEVMPSGRGYFVYVYEDDDPRATAPGIQGGFPKLLTAFGGDVAGPVVLPVTYTNAGTPSENGWNLVGNPYRGSIDWDFVTKADVNLSIYVYDDQASAYRVYNNGIGDIERGVVAAGQGFWVQAMDTDASGTVVPSAVVPVTAQVQGDGHFYGRPGSGGEAPAETAPPHVALTLTRGEHEARAFVTFADGATAGMDAFDAVALAPAAASYAQLSTASEDGEALAIQALPLSPGRYAVGLAASAVEAGAPAGGPMALSWDGAALPSGWTARLVDAATGASADLTAAGTYAFEVVVPEGQTAPAVDAGPPAPLVQRVTTGRFSVVVEAAAVGTEDGAAAVLALGVSPNPVSTGGTVRVSLPEAGVVRVVVYDVLGRQVAVLADGERSAGTHDVALDAGRLAPGVYVVRLTAGEASVVRRVTVAR